MAIFDDSFVGTPGTILDGFNDGPGAWTRLLGNTTQALIASSGAGIKLDANIGTQSGSFFQSIGASTIAGSSVSWVEGRLGKAPVHDGWFVGVADCMTSVSLNCGFSLGTETTAAGNFRVVELFTPAFFIFGNTTCAVGDYMAMEVTVGASTSIKVYVNGVNVITSTRSNPNGVTSSMPRVSGFRIGQGAGHAVQDPAWTRFRADVGLYPGIPSSGGNVVAQRARAITYYNL